MDTSQIILIVVVVIIIVAMIVMMNVRNKKETQKLQEQTNSLKVGDRVLTTAGIYGVVTELKFADTQKLVVIETGGKEKSYLTIDAYAIYSILDSKPSEVKESVEKPAEPKSKKKKDSKEENVAKEEKTETVENKDEQK